MNLVRFPRRLKDGSGDNGEMKGVVPSVCNLQCPPQLARHEVVGVWLDAVHGRVFLELLTGAIAVLHYD